MVKPFSVYRRRKRLSRNTALFLAALPDSTRNSFHARQGISRPKDISRRQTYRARTVALQREMFAYANAIYCLRSAICLLAQMRYVALQREMFAGANAIYCSAVRYVCFRKRDIYSLRSYVMGSRPVRGISRRRHIVSRRDISRPQDISCRQAYRAPTGAYRVPQGHIAPQAISYS